MFHSRTLFPTWKANPGLPPKDRRRARLEALAGVRSISSCIPCFPSLFILSRISQDTVKIMKWSTWRKDESLFLFLFFVVVHWLNIPVPSGSAVTNVTDASHGWLVSHS